MCRLDELSCLTSFCRLCSLRHRVKNLAIAGTATNIATKGDKRFIKIGMWAFLQQFGASHQHSRYTKAALHGTAVNKGLLERVQLTSIRCAFRRAFRREPLDRGNPAVMRLYCRNQARHNGLIIQPDSAGPTLTFGTPLLRSGHSGVLPQHIQQGLPLRVGNQVGLAVDNGGNGASKWTGWRS